ncbi:MAG: DegV family protein [Slackia sp.]
MELGWPVVSAAKAAASGMGLHECAQHVCERVRSTRFIFAPESLRFLEKGGRIGKASALLGNALRISPILTVKDGVASTYAKVRTQKKAMDKMVGILKQDMEEHGLRNIAVHYIGSKQPAEEWARDVIRPLIGRDVAVVRKPGHRRACGPAVESHTSATAYGRQVHPFPEVVCRCGIERLGAVAL